MSIHEMGPRGHYLAGEAGGLAGVSGQQMGQWARYGYIRSSQSSEIPRVYSYQDIAEAMVVHELVEADVEYSAIKACIVALRQKYGHDWPLSHARLKVPAADAGAKTHTIVAEGVDLPVDHPVLTEQGLVEIATDLRRGGWAARKLPGLRHIEVDPDRLSGRPVIAGRRVSAEHVARIARHPGGPHTLRSDYHLTDEEIDDAVEWWSAVTNYETHVAA